MQNIDLKSSAQQQGKVVAQVIQFSLGNKKTIHHVLADTIEQSQFTKFKTEDGKLFMINDKNVDWIEIHSEDDIVNDDKVCDHKFIRTKRVFNGYIEECTKCGLARKSFDCFNGL